MTGLDLMHYPNGIDGCGAPVFSAPLGNWARAFALFAGGGYLPDARHKACRIRKTLLQSLCSLRAKEEHVAQSMQPTAKPITVKTGAEGVYSAAFHELGLGAAVKARDGNKRGAEVAIGVVIRALGYPIKEPVVGFFKPKLVNWAGDEIGDITTPNFMLNAWVTNVENSLCQIKL